MTGLLGGGHAIYFDAATARRAISTCFCAVPGLGARRARSSQLRAARRAVRRGSWSLRGRRRPRARCRVCPPGSARSVAVARPFALAATRAPALRLARAGSRCRLRTSPVRDARAGHHVARGRTHVRTRGGSFRTGDRLVQPGLVHGARGFSPRGLRQARTGHARVRRSSRLSRERGGLVTAADLAVYAAAWALPVESSGSDYASSPAAGSPGCAETLALLPRLGGCPGRTPRHARRALDRRGRPGDAHHESRDGRSRRQRVRASRQPRPRLRRLAPRASTCT